MNPSPREPRKTLLTKLKSYGQTLVAIVGFCVSIYTYIKNDQRVKENNQREVLSQNQRIQSMLFESPELYPYFYQGLSNSTAQMESDTLLDTQNLHALGVKIDIIAEMYCDMFDRLLFTEISGDANERTSWRNYCRQILVKSPAIRHFLTVHKAWYIDLYNEFEETLSHTSVNESIS